MKKYDALSHHLAFASYWMEQAYLTSIEVLEGDIATQNEIRVVYCQLKDLIIKRNIRSMGEKLDEDYFD